VKTLKSLILGLLLLSIWAQDSLCAEAAVVTISNLQTTYNGSPQGVTVETTPKGILVQVSYNGYAESLPSNAGNYSVTATITDPNYEGSATANFEIKKLQVPLQIGNLQQTFNGRYLPVSISVPDGQNIPLDLIPAYLEVSYSPYSGYGATVGYSRSDGNTYVPNNQTSLPLSNAGTHWVWVSYDDGNVACTASATLVVAKGQLSDFLRVSQNQAFDYGAYGWPSIYGIEVNPAYIPSGAAIDFGGSYYWMRSSIGFYSVISFMYSGDWNYGYLMSSGSSYLGGHGFDSYSGYSATLRSDGSPLTGSPHGGEGNGYTYTFSIYSTDSNLEGSLSVPFGIRQASFPVQVSSLSYEFDGNYWPLSVTSSVGYGQSRPMAVYVWCNWQNWVSIGGYNDSYRGILYPDYSNSSYSPNGGNQPILPPGNWSIRVDPAGPDDNSFDGTGYGTVNISKKSISFQIDSSGGILQQTNGSANVPVTLSGVVLYDQYGRSISAGPQSYYVGNSPYGSSSYRNTGTNPPNIQVSYRNNVSGAVTQVEYQVSSAWIPQYNNSGMAMVGDLVYTPVENQPLPPGGYDIRVESYGLGYNSSSGDGSNFLDYFNIINGGHPYSPTLATLQVLPTHVAPEITSQPTASAIVFGQSLSASVLAGGSASYNGTQVEGVFSYANPQNQPSAGESTQEVTFTPNDTGAYLVVTTSIPVLVEKATPLISETPSAQVMKYGQELSASALSGGLASVPGSFAFSNPAFAPPLGNSVQSIVFIPSDSGNYTSVGANVTVTVLDPQSDEDSDGLPNLLEYFMGLNPTATDYTPQQAVIIGSNLTLNYRRSKAISGTFGQVEWTTSLSANATWSSANVTDSLLIDQGAHESRRATVPILPGESKKFLRLRVSPQ